MEIIRRVEGVFADAQVGQVPRSFGRKPFRPTSMAKNRSVPNLRVFVHCPTVGSGNVLLCEREVKFTSAASAQTLSRLSLVRKGEGDLTLIYVPPRRRSVLVQSESRNAEVEGTVPRTQQAPRVQVGA